VTAVAPPTAAVVVVAALLGLGVGALVARSAARFPWRGSTTGRTPGAPVPALVLVLGTAALFALTAERFGASAELPAFLVLAGVAVLLTAIDVRHRLLPDRVVLPALAAGVVLLTGAAALEGSWPALVRAVVAAAVLFAVYLVLALISPRSLGMGDVKLAALIGLHLGWLGWPAVVVGAAAGFVVQAVVALLLLAARRIGLRSELPFGPAMLLGAALAIGGAGALVR
jgi:leader peptidase (prepilin peptidase)/N-methyltransferase